MLTDIVPRNLKPKPYKASDRDGMYVTVSTAGTIAFRYDYRLNGRRETLTLDKYGLAGISLADAHMADSTRAMRTSIVDRDILPAFKNRLLTEIGADDLRALCNKVTADG